MRLLRLDLLRYGHLTDVSLDFPAGAALHVVHGPNEAGKSTALEAIADALFGFPARTGRDFLHESKALRIGITLAGSDGAVARFQRRKGRQATLLDEAEQPLPEEALRRFLGGAGRDLFETGFGLDGARLREGGRELLRSGGESGESLLAGMGMLHLHQALNRLEEEAKSLVGDGRGRRKFSMAMEAWQQARRAAEEAAIRPRDWEEAMATQARVLEELRQLQAAMGTLAEEASRLQRIRRVRPRLLELDTVREDLAQVAAAPRLPPAAEESLRAAREALRTAAADAAREAEEAGRLTGEREALPRDPAVLGLQDAIDTLAERRAVVLQAAADLPEVEARLLEHRATAQEAARELGAEAPIESLRDALPAEAVRRRANRLLQDRVRLLAQREAASAALAKAQRQRDEAAATLGAAPPPPSPAPLRRAIEAARGEGQLDREIERADRALARAGEEVSAALAALPLWSGDAAALAACALPLEAEAEAAARRLAAAERDVAQAGQDLAGLATEVARLEEEIADLAAGDTVPTREAVAAKRAERDRAWRLIRRGLEGGAPPAPAELAGLTEGPLPDGFEALRDAADRLADRRAEEAQRVADYALRMDRLARSRGRREMAEAAFAAARETLATADAAWQGLWAPTGVAPGRPEAMAEWRRARQAVLALAAAGRAAREARDDLLARRAAARAALVALLPEAPAGEALAPLLAAAEERCRTAEEAVQDHRGLAGRLAQEEARLPELRERAEAAATALAALEAEWGTAVAALGLPPGAGAAALEAALAAWTRIAEAAQAWRADERRIADMRAAIDGFARDAETLLARLPDAEGGAAPVAVLGLARRLAAARKAEDEAAALATRIDSHGRAMAEAEGRRDAAAQAIAALRLVAGASDDAALEAAIALARRRDRLVEEQARLERALLDQSDGLSEPALRAEAATIDTDSAAARLQDIEAQRAGHADRLARLGGERNAAEQALRAMEQGRDAAAHAQAAEHALAEARAAAERYARLHLARRLLHAGIERFRAERQTPLLRAAGGHFALLTGGRYARLAAEEDERGRILLRAIRADGTDCAVEALSEGTRDQLYLALRVAFVESHAANAEPLPFVADDLLVHFDDTRAAAAIALLARLGQVTQVILFSHHDHIADLASRQPGVHVQALPALAAGAAPAARSAA